MPASNTAAKTSINRRPIDKNFIRTSCIPIGGKLTNGEPRPDHEERQISAVRRSLSARAGVIFKRCKKYKGPNREVQARQKSGLPGSDSWDCRRRPTVDRRSRPAAI